MCRVIMLDEEGFCEVEVTDLAAEVARLLVQVHMCASILDLVKALSTTVNGALEWSLLSMDPQMIE